MARYLKNTHTGAVFLYTDALAKHPDLRPFEPARADVAPAPVAKAAPAPTPAAVEAPATAEVVNVAGMTKAEVLEYAEAVYGVDLVNSKKVAELRAELAAIIEARG